MAATVLSDLTTTLKTSFNIKLAALNAAGLTAARTFTLPDKAGTVKVEDKAETAASKIYAYKYLR